MAVKNILEEIERDVIDVTQTNFVHNDTRVVPNAGDWELTYERGKDKKGKKIETCVLYVDIRNSVALTEKHHTQTMGRIYTAFTKAVLKVARHHNGHTRNIIGDRVMIIFPTKDCYKNAVDCAISINHIAQFVINKHFKTVDFKCGIGIDFGELRVIKVGIQRNGTENGENKGLVWVGYPANIASRLTDVANKKIEETYYEVTRNPINPRAVKPIFNFSSLYGGASSYDPKAPFYLTTIQKVEMTPEEFANSISQFSTGELYTTGGNLIKFEKKVRTTAYPNILMTDAVYKGFKAANPNRNAIINNYWLEQKHNIKNVGGKVYGGNVTWDLQN
jgi:adenylate cyclase